MITYNIHPLALSPQHYLLARAGFVLSPLRVVVFAPIEVIIKDGVSFSDAPSTIFRIGLEVEEGAKFSDITRFVDSLSAYITEGIYIKDELTIPTLRIPLSLSDGIGFSSICDLKMQMILDIESRVSFADVVRRPVLIAGDIEEGMAFSDNTSTIFRIPVTCIDGAEFTDTPHLLMKMLLDITSGIIFEGVALDMTPLPRGRASVIMSLESSDIVFNLSRTEIEFLLRQPKIDLVSRSAKIKYVLGKLEDILKPR